MTAFIAYYRVSTDRQGQSGLGLDAQRTAVLRHIGTGQLAAEYTEIESGKKHTNRPQLLTALAECRRRKATLVIAKVDRLGRNVAFISALMQENGADFVCCDNPHANRLMLHMLSPQDCQRRASRPQARAEVLALMHTLQGQGKSYRAIARDLNRLKEGKRSRPALWSG